MMQTTGMVCVEVRKDERFDIFLRDSQIS